MKEYTFKLTETWATTVTFTADSLEEAYEQATMYHDTNDIDITTANFAGSSVEAVE